MSSDVSPSAPLTGELPNKFLQMDDEGFFVLNGQRTTEEEFGKTLIDSITRHETGTFLVNSHGTWAILEAFDEPLMVQFVEKQEGEVWKIILPYHASREFNLNTITLDEWDRFHGRTLEGLPFVMTRKAQAQFFNLLDEYEDDAFIVNGKRYETPYWLSDEAGSGKEQFWSDIYKSGEKLGWDQDGPAPALPIIIPQLKIPRSRVLVLGCGRAHDAAYFAELGHIVTAVDISEEALAQAKERYGHLNINFELQDAFNLPKSWAGQFDIVFEHTCYCAIPPQRRDDLVKAWKKVLAPGGHLLGVFFAMDRTDARPPFGGSEWELRERFKNTFNNLYWMRWRQSHPRRQGRELIVYAQKK